METSSTQPETGTPPPEGQTGTPPETGSTATTTPETGNDGQSEKDDGAYWKAQADKWERRAKANTDAAKKLDSLQRQAMSDQERAAAEAADQARTATVARLGGQLVSAELRAAAGDRLTRAQADALVTHLNVGSFLDEDGTVDVNAVRRYVDALAPEPPAATEAVPVPVFPELGQGPRSHGNGTGPRVGASDPLLNDLKSKLGIPSQR